MRRTVLALAAMCLLVGTLMLAQSSSQQSSSTNSQQSTSTQQQSPSTQQQSPKQAIATVTRFDFEFHYTRQQLIEFKQRQSARF